jgi:hypothetical protein
MLFDENWGELCWTTALDPLFGSFTLLELVSHKMNRFFDKSA